ncbi:hypothetical protein SDC9_186548 [bioreactor metagenome]|uniref:Uncharacterized protein n=1 Tax=bioreactor metagenome TaxID=1076179 RepID=A0A645HKT8_9ZZZZ
MPCHGAVARKHRLAEFLFKVADGGGHAQAGARDKHSLYIVVLACRHDRVAQ